MKYDVFISYSRKDIAVADRICSVFDKVGINYFIDRVGISGGFEFPAVLADAIIESRIFLYLASNNSYESKFTQSEITFAFNEKPKGSILPYIIDGSTMPPALRFVFSSINWRRLDEHPIDTVLIDDLLLLLGKKRNESSEKNSHADAEKCFLLGKEAFNKEKYEEAVKWFRKAAEQEDADDIELIKLSSEVLVHADAEICFRLGEEAFNKEKYEEAVKWYRKAAEQGDADAQCNLGWCYEHGRGISKDEVEAVKWYRKAAEQGNLQAQYNLGWCYQYGSGISKDKVQAVKWYRKAAEQGHEDAIKVLKKLQK